MIFLISHQLPRGYTNVNPLRLQSTVHSKTHNYAGHATTSSTLPFSRPHLRQAKFVLQSGLAASSSLQRLRDGGPLRGTSEQDYRLRVRHVAAGAPHTLWSEPFLAFPPAFSTYRERTLLTSCFLQAMK